MSNNELANLPREKRMEILHATVIGRMQANEEIVKFAPTANYPNTTNNDNHDTEKLSQALTAHYECARVAAIVRDK
jgi:hypothetical protein